MNVLSLFDGMSCGQQALERIGIKVDNYYASEIDKYAIQVTMANYPNTIQLGSVVDVDGYLLPKIDLLIGGSPCQSFSFAGKRKGMSTKDEQEILTLEHYLELKAEGYEFEGQSYLFWEYMRLLNECKPTYFLLENVEMGEKWEKVLSKAIGVNGIHINSALVSAQNRKRIYWTNIGMQPSGLFGDLESIIEQPKNKGILLKDILEDNVDEKYFLSDKGKERILSYNNAEKTINIDNRSLCLTAGYNKQGRDNQYVVHNTMPRSSTSGKGGTGPLSREDGKTYCLDTGNTNAVEIIKSQTEKLLEKTGIDISNIMEPTILDVYNKTLKNDGKCITLTDPCHNNLRLVVPNISVEIVAQRGRGENNVQQLESRNDGKTNSLTSVQKDNLVREIKQISDNNKSNGCTQPYQQDRIYDINGISPALSAGKSDLMISIKEDNLVREIKQLNENQLKKFNPNINADKANTLTLAQGRAGSSEEYMDSISKIAKLTSRIRRLTPIECERLQTVKDNEISCIFTLCYDQAKIYVDAVSQNPRLLKLVLNAENSELNELVKSVLLSMSVSNQSIKHIVPKNADMQIQKETNQCINLNLQESNINANNVGLNVMCNYQEEWEDFAQPNVFINIIEGRIMHFGLEELPQKDNHFTNLLNGLIPLKLYGNEIMQLVKGVNVEMKKNKDTNFTYTTLYRSNTNSLDQALIIYYLFAKNVITGFTQNTIQPKDISLNFKFKDGYSSIVSDSQRYRMLGNGWTIDVISHIFSYIK